MVTRTPPRYVPTLTEVVQVPAASVPEAPAAPTPAGAARVSGPPPAWTDEQWVQRIMQRVDLTLDKRLREAIARVVLEQTRTLAPLLREQVEMVVRESVAQAMADELAALRKTGRHPP